jgi:phosphate:Na+ symporter
MDTTTIITTSLALVVIFIFAVQKFSRNIQRTAGERLKNILNRSTDKPYKGVIGGALVTGIIQSSTATSVILVGLVNAGVMQATNAISVVVGANIGTTITAQLVALNMTYISPIIVICGFIIAHTHSKFKKYGKGIFYFGVIFLSLFIISNIVSPLKDNIAIQNILSSTNNFYTSIIVGIIITAILQSSSVFTGLVLVFASQGLVTLPAAIGFMLGSNIGTPLTAIIASTSTGIDAKKVAISHMTFNILGVLLLLPFIQLFISLLGIISDNEIQQIVNAHFLFNTICAVVCIIFFDKFEKLVTIVTKTIYKN